MNQTKPPTNPVVTDHRPYLMRAMHAWISDNNLLPELIVDCSVPGVQVPTHAINNGFIVLNVHVTAVAQLEMRDDFISFAARFGGKSIQIFVPTAAVMAIRARGTMIVMDFPKSMPTAMAVPPPPGETLGAPELPASQRAALERPLRAAPSISNGPPAPPVVGGVSAPPPRRAWTPTLVPKPVPES